ncbi:hypothetical protein SDC9_128656 [bioreactor metagenome]|uniref:Branched-chain amino acid transport system / permease component n=1 Tax=bioreactor metagenome TaxID=1076179 RepID=A0A645CWQ5_9ZZZZ
MIPIAFSGLACSLLFRTGLFNLGIEGIYFIGGVVTAAVACTAINSYVFHPILSILIPAIVGGLLMLIPGFLKAKFNANELVVSLMLNSIYLGLGLFIIKNYLRGIDTSAIASPAFKETAMLDYIIPNTRITISFFLLLATALFVYILLYKTKLGYSIRMTGLNMKFAVYSGMNAFTLFMLVHFISGFIGGMGTSVELLSLYGRFTWIVLPGLGFTGALMAMLGRNNPLGVLVAAFFISYLNKGAEVMALGSDVPVEITAIIQAVLVLLISSQYFLRKWREKQLLKEGTADESE